MKKIILLFLLFSTASLFSQNYIVKNHEGEKIEGVMFYSEENKNISSNKIGEVNLSIFSKEETIEIYHLSYLNKKFKKEDIKNNTILIYSKNFTIKEVKVHSSLKTEENKTQLIQLSKIEIQNSLAKNPAELLEKSSCLSVQKSQNGGGSPNIRGFEANRILLIVDNVKLNNTIYRGGHLQNILSIDPYILENVSVLHGPSSVFYGSGALGGAIILNTLNIEDINENKSSFIQQFESSSSSIISHFNSKFKYSKTSFLSSISLKKYGNLKMGRNRFHGYDDWGKEKYATKETEQLFGEYSQIDITQKIHHKINNLSTISINSQFSTTSNINRFDKLNDIKDNNPKYKFWYYGPQKRILHSIKYEKEKRNILSDKYNLQFSFQDIEESRHSQKFSEESLTIRKENIQVYDSKINFNKRISNFQINYGFSNRFQNLQSEGFNEKDNGEIGFTASRYPDNGSTDFTISSFLLTEFKVLKKLKWFNAIRYDYNKIQINFSEGNPFYLEDKLNIVNDNYSASSNLFYSLNKNNFLSFSIFNSFRNPNVDDIGKVFSKTDGVVVVPNTNLNSEKILSSEFIWKHIRVSTTIEMVLFHSYLKDAIEKRSFSFNGNDSILYDGEMMMCIANTNINSAKMNGLNFRIKQKVNEKISFSGSASLVKGVSSDLLPLAHIPPFSARSEISYSFVDKSILSFYSKYNDWKRLSDFDLNGVDNIEEATIDGTPSWITLNLIYIKKIKDLTFSISCENILDSHYKTFASGISASGRNFIINLQTNF